ncbi:hypothetical protein Ppa06_64590 [Planomonospora parontospora subsp. parontospora]|uniref:DUF2637 domain-containing protein n=2 Tax=Planomonospora parontospora TaxID=58119 RepID=A0AA37BMU4_9ACTN|nr:DUF2637 domain-containing protein [Planomonospora parontospora]GGK94248.1 hypothetical protein GCM10010126_62050 [Planomonospora parontospora]GII12661.1 hypothetical protein Ppa06_64590 [Planomonospora parontospora subsp. parontospora]
MTTYYDPRAQRLVADAQAEQARAAAEATRAETMLRLEEARTARAAAAAEAERREREMRAASAAARRRLRRQEREQAKAARRARLRRGAGALAAAALTRAPVIVGAIAMGAPIAIAWRGQLEFATHVMHLGFMAPALPIALEGGVWYLAFLVHRAITARLPIGRYRVATWAMAAIAAGMNLWHGVTANKTDGLQVGVILALASLLGIALWELTASLTQQSASKRTAAEIRRAAWRRLRYPRLSWAAASIRASRGEQCSIEEAWTAAWIDRYGVGPQASRRDRTLARSIVRYQRAADRQAAKDGRLLIVDGSIVRPGEPGPHQSAEAEEAMARLKAFTERRQDVARSIAFPSIGSPAIESPPQPAASIEADRPAEPATAPIDRAPSIETQPIAVVRSIESTPAPAGPSIERRSGRSPIDPAGPADPIESTEAEPAPRRSIEEHRAALRAAIEAGDIDPREATAEEIRRTLSCAPRTARILRDELKQTESAA